MVGPDRPCAPLIVSMDSFDIFKGNQANKLSTTGSQESHRRPNRPFNMLAREERERWLIDEKGREDVTVGC